MKHGDKVRVIKDTLIDTPVNATGYYRSHEGETGWIVKDCTGEDWCPFFPIEVELDGRDYSSMFAAEELEVIE